MTAIPPQGRVFVACGAEVNHIEFHLEDIAKEALGAASAAQTLRVFIGFLLFQKNGRSLHGLRDAVGLWKIHPIARNVFVYTAENGHFIVALSPVVAHEFQNFRSSDLRMHEERDLGELWMIHYTREFGRAVALYL